MLAMPNAAGVKPLGDLFRMRARAVRQRVSLCPQCGITRRIAKLPCGRCRKTSAWRRLVSVEVTIRRPPGLLVHQLKFYRSEIAPLARLLLPGSTHGAPPQHWLQLPGRIVSVFALVAPTHWRRGI